jgi:ABC-type phosphate transport system substrate-binding protein
MKAFQTFFVLALLIPFLAGAASDDLLKKQDIQVVVNRQAELTELTQQQVLGLFLGRVRNFPNGKAVKAIDNEVSSDIRARFFETLTGKSISDIDAYWARLRYSGRASPPREMKDTGSILDAVRQNREAIAYIPWQDPEELAKQDIVVVYSIKGQ